MKTKWFLRVLSFGWNSDPKVSALRNKSFELFSSNVQCIIVHHAHIFTFIHHQRTMFGRWVAFCSLLIRTRRHQLQSLISDTVFIFSWKFSLILIPSAPHLVLFIYSRFMQCIWVCFYDSIVFRLFIFYFLFVFSFAVSDSKHQNYSGSTRITWFVEPLFEKQATS